jgi:hypothetical protein
VRDGDFTLDYTNGEVRRLRIRIAETGILAGKQIVSIYDQFRLAGCGFLSNNTLRFFRSFRHGQCPQRLERIRGAVKRVLENPDAAAVRFASSTGRCSFCHRKLADPARSRLGMGCTCFAYWSAGLLDPNVVADCTDPWVIWLEKPRTGLC